MPGPAIVIPMPDAPFKNLNDQIKAEQKELKDLVKLLDEAKKKGKDVQEINAKIGAKESSIGGLQAQKKRAGYDQGAADFHQSALDRVKSAQEGHHARVGSQLLSGNFRGAAGSLAQGAFQSTKFGAQVGELAGAVDSAATTLAETTGKLAARVAVPVAIAAAVIKGINALTPYSESYRQYQNQRAVDRTSEINPTDVALGKAEDQRRELDHMTSGLTDLPIIGTAANVFQFGVNKLRGTSGQDVADLAIRQTINRSGLNVDQSTVNSIGANRAFKDSYGTVFGTLASLADSVLQKIHLEPDWLADKRKAGVAGSVDRAAKMNAQGFQLLEENNFEGAEQAFKKGAEEVGNATWRNARDAWMIKDQGTKYEREYARNQNMIPPLRIGM